MSERKVLNKYYPPDFDPSKIPRLKLARDRQYVVRLMAPCNMKCTTCGEYIYKGKKFNARKETVQDEDYLGIRIFRFYIRCPRCLAEITFKTNPKEADYDLEHGATRNFQALKTAEKLEEAARIAEEEEEKNNPMKMLEKRTMQSRLEMERIEALEELKELNERQATVDFEGMLNRNLKQQRETEEERAAREELEIEQEVSQMLEKKGIERSGGITIKRIKDVDSDEEKNRESKLLKSDPMLNIEVAPKPCNSLVKLKHCVKINETPKSHPTSHKLPTSVDAIASKLTQGSSTRENEAAGNLNSLESKPELEVSISRSAALSEIVKTDAFEACHSGLNLICAYSDSSSSNSNDS